MEYIMKFVQQMGFYEFFANIGETWPNLVMMAVACVLIYLAIVKKFEPLLLLPIAFGMLLTNLPLAGVYNEVLFAGGHVNWSLFGGNPITQEMIDYLLPLIQGEVHVPFDHGVPRYIRLY